MSYNPSEFKQHFPSIAAHLGPTGIEIFTRILVPTRATAGEVLISCGARIDTLYLIWQGLLAISIEAGGKKLLLGEVGSGKWVGEITMIEPGSATTTVIAKEHSALLALSHDEFETDRRRHRQVRGFPPLSFEPVAQRLHSLYIFPCVAGNSCPSNSRGLA